MRRPAAHSCKASPLRILARRPRFAFLHGVPASHSCTAGRRASYLSAANIRKFFLFQRSPNQKSIEPFVIGRLHIPTCRQQCLRRHSPLSDVCLPTVSRSSPRRPTFVSPSSDVRHPTVRRSSSCRPTFVSPLSVVRHPAVRRSSDNATVDAARLTTQGLRVNGKRGGGGQSEAGKKVRESCGHGFQRVLKSQAMDFPPSSKR